MNQSIESLLIKSQLAINKSLNSVKISKALFELGYNKEVLNKGKDLIDFVKKLRTQYDNRLFQKLDETNYLFEKHVKLARIVFIQDQDAWERLNLHPSKNHNSEKWIEEADFFYSLLIENPTYVEAMKHYGTEKAILDYAMTNIENLECALKEDISFNEELKKRDSAYNNLQEWMIDFESKARVALQKTPEDLRQLGINQY